MSDRPDEPITATGPLTTQKGLLPWNGPDGTHAGVPSGDADAVPFGAPLAGHASPASPWLVGDAEGPPSQSESSDAEDLELLDQGWTPPRRVNRFTVLLAAGLVAALGFAGGVLVQKNHDSGQAGTPGAGTSGRALAANGFAGAGGGFAGGFGGAFPGGGTTGGTGSGTGSGAGTGSGTPVVVGTVVSVGRGSFVVKNFAGTQVTVRVPAGASITTRGLTGLRTGVSVSVVGTKAGDGSVTATSVTSRG